MWRLTLASGVLFLLVFMVLIFMVCIVRQNLYVFSLYHNPDLDDQIFYCLLASMAAVQAEDINHPP